MIHHNHPMKIRTRTLFQHVHTIIVMILVFALPACEQTPSSENEDAEDQTSDQPPWFKQIADERGLEFVHDSGQRGERLLMPETICGGVAVLDAENDGDLDVYLIQSGDAAATEQNTKGNKFFVNDGNGSFTEATASSGLGDTGYGNGVTTGDFNNDGFMDIYVTNLGANVLYQNTGDTDTPRFTDITRQAGVGGDAYSASAAFVDYDRDGDLDLFVTNYIHWSPEAELDCFTNNGLPDYCSPNSYDAPARDTLYRNNDDGTFTDVSVDADIDASYGNGLGVACADFNQDGWIDIFVANDQREDQLWINQQDGTFVDEAQRLGVAVDGKGAAKAGMGVDVIDYDYDGDRDLLVVNLRNETDSFFTNHGSYFVDDTGRIGLGFATRTRTRFGVGFIDFNHDGFLDLYEAAGRVQWAAKQYTDDIYAEPNVLLRGTDTGRLEPVAPAGGTRERLIHTSRGAAFGDIDNDGGVDTIVTNRDSTPYLLKNIVADRGNRIMFDIRNEHGSPAIGATLRCRVNDRRITRDVRTAYSYCSANDPRVHIGLGEAQSIHDVSVQWVDGSTTQFDDVRDVNRIVTLSRPSDE